ncbi:hypothetical protein K458DRAFT_413797 [Lentithecium fluviatile CBS 122367]|uniref:Uncharacterized protein n=1 Tax=Lentithecium fluviatile CBS 122367 TaxID=1168545 RepID=A0A6G1JHB1_9PLEO|nr:hypothetical protein K458DRAFT_413797 [Lentithecium fluviatile CBS 122367]
MTKLTTQASLGIGIPLGIILILTIGGIIWANVTKRKRKNRGDVELVEGQDKPQPPPKVIRWNPHG